MASLPNVLSIDCGIESPHGPGAALFRSRKPKQKTDEGSGGGRVPSDPSEAGEEEKEEEMEEWLPMRIRIAVDQESGRVKVHPQTNPLLHLYFYY